MKLEKTDMKILTFMVRDIRKEYSIKQLADQLKTPYVKVHASIQRLLKKGILKKKIFGKSHYCSIDYKNSLDVVCFAEAQRARNFFEKRKEIKLLISNIEEKLPIPDYSLIIFGSFVENRVSKNSDLDIALITPQESLEKAGRVMNSITRTTPLKIHSIEFSYTDLIEMLKSKELTVGKEIAKNHIIIQGCEQFFECLRLSE